VFRLERAGDIELTAAHVPQDHAALVQPGQCWISRAGFAQHLGAITTILVRSQAPQELAGNGLRHCREVAAVQPLAGNSEEPPAAEGLDVRRVVFAVGEVAAVEAADAAAGWGNLHVGVAAEIDHPRRDDPGRIPAAVEV